MFVLVLCDVWCLLFVLVGLCFSSFAVLVFVVVCSLFVSGCWSFGGVCFALFVVVV